MTTMRGAGQYEGRTMEVTFSYAKAIWGAVIGFVTPGVSFLSAQLLPGGDGVINTNDWLIAAAFCILGAGATGGAVAVVQNKARVTDIGPA